MTKDTHIYQKTITNSADTDQYVGAVLIYELHSLEEEGLSPSRCRLFRTGRHKNDLPSVCTFGHFDDSMRDCLSTLSENGGGMDSAGTGLIVSDHLTILGTEEDALFIAFTSGSSQMLRTEIRVDQNGQFLGLKTYVEFNCLLRPGESRTTEALSVSHTSDIARAIKDWALARLDSSRAALTQLGSSGPVLTQLGSSGAALPAKARPAVFCTWYYYGLNVTYSDVIANLDEIRRRRLPFTVFQVDDGWEVTLGEWTPNSKFPADMREVSDLIRSYGLTPGIWTGPFVAHSSASVWRTHPDWILRGSDGAPLIFSVNGGDYLIFDITIDETAAYFEEMYRHLTTDLGFVYHKLDFTRAPIAAEGAVFANPYITPVEAYVRAIRAIRRGMGDSSYMLLCGGLYDPAIGICDAQRSGSDVLSMWSNNVCKDLKAAPFTIKQNLLRYYMNYWWHNDPDALMIRRNDKPEYDSVLTYGLLTDDEVRTLTLNQLIGGGLVCSTEPLRTIDDDRLANLWHILPIRPVEVETVNLLSCGRYPDMVRLRDLACADASYLVVINWSDSEAIEPELTLRTIAGSFLNPEGSGEVQGAGGGAAGDRGEPQDRARGTSAARGAAEDRGEPQDRARGTSAARGAAEDRGEPQFTVTDFYGRRSYIGLRADSSVRLPKIPPHSATIVGIARGCRDEKTDHDGHYLFFGS